MKAIDLVIDAGEEGEERRKRAMELGVLANKAFENKVAPFFKALHRLLGRESRDFKSIHHLSYLFTC